MDHALIIVLGFLFAIRGSRSVSFREPLPSFAWIWREATDFFLTLGLAGAFFLTLVNLESCRGFMQDYAVLWLGMTVYLLGKYQKKTDLFFLAGTVLMADIFSWQTDPLYSFSLILAASVGIAFFQTCFLGLRYKLLFSSVPETMKGWPVLCLLASFISLVLWGVGQYAF